MVAPDLKIENKNIYFRKAITSPEFKSKHIITNDHFSFVDLWLKRHHPSAIPFWTQSRNYYIASKALPVEAAPLTSYYCMLNAAKTLLTVRGIDYHPYHGITGKQESDIREELKKEIIEIKPKGVLSSLSKYLGDTEQGVFHNLHDMLGNIPYIHRAYCFANNISKELFIPIHNPRYRIHEDRSRNKIWWSADIDSSYCSEMRQIKTRSKFVHYQLASGELEIVIKNKVNWHSLESSVNEVQIAYGKLNELHKKLRIDVSVISGYKDHWYIKGNEDGFVIIDRHGLVLSMSIMHRLSEIVRYTPNLMQNYLNGKENWLISEFVRASIGQFIDEISCEITSLELKRPKVGS